jgi:hypothetical protein
LIDICNVDLQRILYEKREEGKVARGADEEGKKREELKSGSRSNSSMYLQPYKKMESKNRLRNT